MRSSSFILFLLLTAHFAMAQFGPDIKYDERPDQLKKLKQELLGRYDEVVDKDWLRDNLSNTVFLVRKGKDWGVCLGSVEVIKPQYDKVFFIADPKPNKEGNFRIELYDNGKWGLAYIKSHGNWAGYDYKEIIPPKYDSLIADCNHARYINKADITNIMSLKQNGKWGIVTLFYDGKEEIGNLRCGVLIPFKYDGMKNNIYHGYVLVKNDGKWGILGKGVEKLPMEYDSIVETSTYCLEVMPVRKGNLWGIYDLKEQALVSAAVYDKIECEGTGLKTDNYLRVFKNGKVGAFSRKTKKEIIAPQYDNISIDNNALSVTKDGKTFLFDENGKLLTSKGYDKISHYGSIFLYVYNKGKMGIVDKTKNLEILPPKYDSVEYYHDTKSFYWAIKENGLWGFSEADGKIVSAPKYERFIWGCLVYEEARDNILVLQNKKWGIIDSQGKQLTPCKYDGIFRGMAYKPEGTITLNGKMGKLNIVTGQELIPPVYDDIVVYYNALNSPSYEYKVDHFYQVKKGMRTLYIDAAGNEIPDPHK